MAENRISLCVKTLAFETAHVFNVNQKVKNIVQFALTDDRFGLKKSPEITFKAFLEAPTGNRELRLDQQIDEQGIGADACIIIAPPDNPDG